MHWLELDNSIDSTDIPHKELFDLWVATTLGGQDAQLTIKIISKEQMIELNSQYRQKKQATDVLSFPYHDDYQQEINPSLPYLGDIAICPDVLQEDVKKLDCELQDHWAHIVIHSVLHLLGYDHQLPEDQQEMEQLESKIMQDLKLNDPWELDNSIN
jgi:probable rRNA maturation factor